MKRFVSIVVWEMISIVTKEQAAKKRTSLACSRVNLALGRGAGAVGTAGTGAGAGAEVSGSVKMVACELSTAEVSNIEDVSGEIERWRAVVVVLVVDVEEGGDLNSTSQHQTGQGTKEVRKGQNTSGLCSACLSWAFSVVLSRHGLFAAGLLSSASSTRDIMPGVEVGERRFLDSASRSGSSVRDIDKKRVGEVVATVTVCRGAAIFALTGLSPADLPSCLTLGEHALGSSAPRTRRLRGYARSI